MDSQNQLVSIIILVHNAPRYVKITLDSLRKTKGVNYEVIVVDNNSKSRTKHILLNHFENGDINKLLFLDNNTLFAKGNNIGSEICHKDATHILLLNSDVEIRKEDWLSILLQHHKPGATSFGLTNNKPVRADGYCFLIDKHLYEKYQLDEDFEWWWSVTKLQALVMKDGFKISVIDNHDQYLYHFGGRSGRGFSGAKGLVLDFEEVKKWFEQSNVEVIDFKHGTTVTKFQKYWRKCVDLILN